MPERRMLLCLLALLSVLACPAGAATITVTRDRWVPHIFVPPTVGGRATQLRALAFAQGYVTPRIAWSSWNSW